MPNRFFPFHECALFRGRPVLSVLPGIAVLALFVGLLFLRVPGGPDLARAAGTEDARLIQEIASSDDPAERVELCGRLLGAKPAPYARYFCEGLDAIYGGQDAVADAALQDVLREQPDFALAAIVFGEAYVSMNKPEKAEAAYRRAIELQPARSDARFALGSLLVKRGQEEDPKYFVPALEAFRQMTEADPDSPDGWASMGLVLTYMERFDDAERMYQTAVSKNPRDPFLFHSLGSLYSRSGRDDLAETNWRKALAISPGFGPAVVELAALYARTDRLTRAIEVLEAGREAVQVAPWGPRIRRNLGFAYLRLGKMDAARERLTQATASTDALAFLGLGHLKMIENDPDGAAADFDRGAGLDSTLAVPFVQAWKTALKPTLQFGEHAALARVLAKAEALAAKASQAEATPQLVDFVLEGWSFRDAERVLEEISASHPDSAAGAYDSAPEPLTQVPAEFPEAAQDAGIFGTVEILVTVDETGKVVQTQVVSKDSAEILNDAAVAAVRKWTFKPATRFGSPVKASILIPFRFRGQP